MPPAENRRPRPAPRRARKPAAARPVGAFARGPLSRADAPIIDAQRQAHARTRQVQVRARRNVVVPYVPKLEHPTPTQRKAGATIVQRGLAQQGLARPTLKGQLAVNATLPAAQRQRANRGTGYAHTISREAQIARGLQAIAAQRAGAPTPGEAAASTLGRLARGIAGGTMAERLAAAHELAGVAGLIPTKPKPTPGPLTRSDMARIGRTARRGDPIEQLLPAQGRQTKLGGFLTEKTAIAPNLRVLSMPWQVARALYEEPQARKETLYGVKDLPAGIVTSLGALAEPRKAAGMMAQDLSHRYGPLVAGNSGLFRKQLAEPHSGGAVPFALDAATVTPAAGEVLGAMARAGTLDALGRGATLGRAFADSPLKRISNAARPAIAFSSGPEGFVEQVPARRLGKRLWQHARDKSRARTYADRIRVMRDNPDTYGPAVRTGPAQKTLEHRVREARRALAQEKPGTEAHDMRAATLAKAEAQAAAGVVTHRNLLVLPGGRSMEIPKAMRDRRQPRDVARLKGQARLKQLQEQAILHTHFLDLLRTAPRAERPRLNRIIGYVYGGLVSGASKEKAVADLRELRTQMLEGRARAVAGKLHPDEREVFQQLPLEEQAAHFKIPRGLRRKWNDQVLQLDDLIAEVEKHGVPGSTEHVAKGLRKLETRIAQRNPRLEREQGQLRRYAPAVEALVRKHDRERATIIERVRASPEAVAIRTSKELTDEQRSHLQGELYRKATEHLLPPMRQAVVDEARTAARADDPRIMGRYIERVGLKRIIGALHEEQRLRPGYFPSERRFKASFGVKAVGGSRGKPPMRAYHGDLFRTGREDRRPIVLEQGLQQGIKDRHQMNLIARQAERHMIDVEAFDPSKEVARDQAGRARGRREHARQEAKRLRDEARRQGGRNMSIEEELGRVHGIQAEELLQRRDVLAEHLDEAKAEVANVRDLADDPEALKGARNEVRRIQRQMKRLEERAQELMDDELYVAPRTPRTDVAPPAPRPTTTRERGLLPEEEQARAEVVTRAERARVQVKEEGAAVRAQRAKVKALEDEAAKPKDVAPEPPSAAPAARSARKDPVEAAGFEKAANGEYRRTVNGVEQRVVLRRRKTSAGKVRDEVLAWHGDEALHGDVPFEPKAMGSVLKALEDRGRAAVAVPASEWKVTASQVIGKGMQSKGGFRPVHGQGFHGSQYLLVKGEHAKGVSSTEVQVDKLLPSKADVAKHYAPGDLDNEVVWNGKDFVRRIEGLTDGVVNADFAAYVEKKSPGAEWYVRDGSKPLLRVKDGETVGVVMPIRTRDAVKEGPGALESGVSRWEKKIAGHEAKIAELEVKAKAEAAKGGQRWTESTSLPNERRALEEARQGLRVAQLHERVGEFYRLPDILEELKLRREGAPGAGASGRTSSVVSLEAAAKRMLKATGRKDELEELFPPKFPAKIDVRARREGELIEDTGGQHTVRSLSRIRDDARVDQASVQWRAHGTKTWRSLSDAARYPEARKELGIEEPKAAPAERPLPSERASMKREVGAGEPERIDLDPEKQPLIELNNHGDLVRGRLERIRRRRLKDPDRWGEWRVQVRREKSADGQEGSRVEILASDLQGFKLVEGELPQELQGLVSGERAGLARGPEIIEGTARERRSVFDPELAAEGAIDHGRNAFEEAAAHRDRLREEAKTAPEKDRTELERQAQVYDDFTNRKGQAYEAWANSHPELKAERAKLVAAEARHQVVKDELAAHEQELAHYDGRAKEKVTVEDMAAPPAEPAARPEPGPREPGASQVRAARERLRKASERGVGQPVKELIDDLDEAQINPDRDVTFLNVGRLFRDVSEERLVGARETGGTTITDNLEGDLSSALQSDKYVLQSEQIRSLREKDDPNAFTEYGNGWVAVPRKVGDEILSMASGKGATAGRIFDIGKGKASRTLLGLFNVSWLGFQVASNAFLSGLVGVGPYSWLRAQLWWKGLTDEQRSYMSSIMGTTAHHVDFEQRSLGAAGADSQLVEGWRALKDTPAWRAAHKANPIDALFRMDHAQTAFFRRAVLYKYAKREAFQRMGESVGHAMRAQDRLAHTFFKDAGKTDRHITNALRDRRGIEEHARRVDEILGDYLTFTATERATLNRFTMFYGFLRHSMRLLFWTLPTGHPIALSVLTQLGRLQAEEARQLLGGDQLPYGLGKIYWRAGGHTRSIFHKFGIDVPEGQLMQVDLARMNPALNAVTDLKSRNQVFQVFPPYISLAVEGATSQNLLTGYSWRVNGETSHKAGTPYSLTSWARVMLGRTLQMVPPYRYATKWWFHGTQQGDDALLFSAKPVLYKRADKLAQQKQRQERDAAKTTFARAGEVLFPMFPQVSYDDQVVTNKQLQRQGGSQRAPLPASVPKDVAARVNAALDRADAAAKDAVPSDVQKRIDEALARAAAAGQ